MSAETRILLVRHGQSEWNATGRWQGQADPPLTDLGRVQAMEAARAIGAVDAVWASDLSRASQTGLIIAEAIGVGPVVLEPDLRERDAGEWSGMTREQIEEQYPGYLEERKRPPGWEPDDELLARALRAVTRIGAEVPGGDVVAITHGGLVYVLEEHLGAEFARIANVEGRWIVVSGDRLTLGDRLLLAEPEDVTVPRQI